MTTEFLFFLIEAKKFGSHKCHFAMSQAFLDQMECLGAL
jgi:hypothetical protein